MTVILVDKADRGRDLQLANLVWDCIVSNLEREGLFAPETTDLLGIWSVGQLGAEDAKRLALAIKERFLSRLSDDQVLFFDGRIGEVSVTEDGFALETPYQLVSHVSKATLERLHDFLSASDGFDVC